MKIVFFGGEPLGVPVLKKLQQAGTVPTLVVCNPDRHSGRGLQLTKPPVKVWAEENEIEVFQPSSYKDIVNLERLTEDDWDLFVVVAYNFILPEWLLKIPKHGVINVHPSLLPKLRGASPIRTAIMEDKREEIGVTIMLMDEKMDHGPILNQATFPISNQSWPLSGPELDQALAELGGELLAITIPAWLAGKIKPQAQDHDEATYTTRLTKDQAELPIDLTNLPSGEIAWKLFLKIKAFTGIGDTFFIHQGKRIKVKAATLSGSGQLEIISVVPEGKKETSFTSYLHSLTT